MVFIAPVVVGDGPIPVGMTGTVVPTSTGSPMLDTRGGGAFCWVRIDTSTRAHTPSGTVRAVVSANALQEARVCVTWDTWVEAHRDGGWEWSVNRLGVLPRVRV